MKLRKNNGKIIVTGEHDIKECTVEIEDIRKTKSTMNEDSSKCKICKNVYNGQKGLKIHLRKSNCAKNRERKKYDQIKNCFVKITDIGKDLQNNSQLKCNTCGKTFKGEKGLKIHIARSNCTMMTNNTNNSGIHNPAQTPLADTTTQVNQGFCSHARCATCPAINRTNTFISSVTGREYTTIGADNTKKICKIQNYIYLLTCNGCNAQYVGESIIPLHKRMNIHRTAKSGCEIFINHFTEVCPNQTFSIQIIETLQSDGYSNGSRDEELYTERLDREDYWMKTLRTVYPYGLNEKTKKMNKLMPVGKLFSPLSRYGDRQKLVQRTRNGNSNEDLTSFIQTVFLKPIAIRNNFCRKRLESKSIRQLKKLASEAFDNLADNCDPKMIRWYEMIQDFFLTKKYKDPKKNTKNKKISEHLIKVNFHNKGLDFIRLPSILSSPDLSSLFPSLNNNGEGVPTVIYKLNAPIRSKIFNYIDTVNNIDKNDNNTYGTHINSCECSASTFCDPNHGHIITGNLAIIKDNKLRKILSKGPNYREQNIINWKACRQKIEIGVNDFIHECNMKKPNLNFNEWKNKLLSKIDDKIRSLKPKVKIQHKKKIIEEPGTKQYLEEFHAKYVIVPIDKASNNIAVICKKFYVDVILKELGKIGECNQTYSDALKSKEDIIADDFAYIKHLKLDVQNENNKLPIMYWMPKMHKNPIGMRFIIASKHCSNKPLSKTISNIFKLIFNQIQHFHKNQKFMKNYNTFWVLNNIEPVIENIERINKRNNAKSISTFDFSTLYTKIPHPQLIEKLNCIIDFVFDGGKNKCIRISKNGNAYWGNIMKNSVCFTNTSLKCAVKHLIKNCYFNVGNHIMRQAIGIPMGIDPAPFWANLFLYSYEEKYVNGLVKNNQKVKAMKFHSTSRFIDDLCAINDGGEFGNVFHNIYPDSLELKVEHSGNHATFLNLDITIIEKKFIYKLYDKRQDFPFTIVRMPHKDSNIPEAIFYSALVGEALRIARSSMLLDDLVLSVNKLLNRMIKQGGKKVG